MKFIFLFLSVVSLSGGFDHATLDAYEEHRRAIQKGAEQLEKIRGKLLKFQCHVKNHHDQFSKLLKYLHQFERYSSSLSMLSIPSRDDLVHVLVVSDYLNVQMNERQKNLVQFLKKYSAFKKSYNDLQSNLGILKSSLPDEEKKIIALVNSVYKEDLTFVKEVDARLKSVSDLKDILKVLLTLPVTDGEEVHLSLIKPVQGGLSSVSPDPEVSRVHTKILPEFDGFCKNPMDAIVVFKGSIQGRVALILQYNPYQIVFWGLKDVYCKVGDIVKPNMPIAYVKKGEEVQLEVYKDGVNIDALPFIKSGV